MTKKVCIIILNWNNWKDTLECLESVYQSTYPYFEVVVVDNGSTDGSEEKIREWAGDRALVLRQAGSNLGYSGGNNIGLQYVLEREDFAYAWLLNNDTIVYKDALLKMVDMAESDEKIGMVGSNLLNYYRPDVLQTAGGFWIIPWTGNTVPITEAGFPYEPDYISGASVLVRKNVLERIGLLDEDYFLYWEDADWGVRARKANYRLLYCPESNVRHKEGGAGGGVTPLTDYYWTRNGLMFTRRYSPWYLPFVFFAYLVKFTLVRTVKRQPHNFMAFLRGVLSFLIGRKGRGA
jgi:GT2 family glycosyltransferase